MNPGLSEEEIALLRKQMDRAAIRELIESSYLYGIDARTPELAAGIYTQDCHFSVMSGQQQFRGHATFLEGVSRLSTFLNHSCHTLGNLRIELDGDRARSETHAVAFLDINAPEAGRKVIVRGLQYLHKWRREADGWRSYDMIHNQLWQSEMEYVDPAIPVFDRQ